MKFFALFGLTCILVLLTIGKGYCWSRTYLGNPNKAEQQGAYALAVVFEVVFLAVFAVMLKLDFSILDKAQ